MECFLDRKYYNKTGEVRFLDDYRKYDGNECVYILESNGYYKIGYSNKKLSQRIRILQTGNPLEIRLVMIIYPRSTPRREEKRLHIEYANKKMRGEWFALDNGDLNNIIRRYFRRMDYVK